MSRVNGRDTIPLMAFAKNFGLKLTVALFSLCVFGLAVAFSINSVFGTPDNLKASLQRGGVYEVVSSEIAKQLAGEAAQNSEIPVDTKTMEHAAAAAITPTLVQQNTEKVIDGTYSWLDGTTPTPTFRIDVADIQKHVSTNLGDAAIDRAGKLPLCTQTQLQKLNMSELDPFSIPCRPPGMDVSTLRQQFVGDLFMSNSSSADKTITARDITNEAGQNVFAQASQAPQAFQFGQKLPWIFGVLAIISATIVGFLNTPRLRGVKSLSITLFIVGILLLGFMAIVAFVLHQVGSNITGASSETGGAVLTVVRSLANQMNSPLKIFAITYVILGIAGLILPRLLKRKPRITPATTTPYAPIQSETPTQNQSSDN